MRVRWSQQLDVAPSTLAFEMLSRFTFPGCLGCSGSIRRVSCWSNDDQPHSSRGAQHVTLSGTPKILVCLGVAAMRVQGMYDARNARKKHRYRCRSLDIRGSRGSCICGSSGVSVLVIPRKGIKTLNGNAPNRSHIQRYCSCVSQSIPAPLLEPFG